MWHFCFEYEHIILPPMLPLLHPPSLLLSPLPLLSFPPSSFPSLIPFPSLLVHPYVLPSILYLFSFFLFSCHVFIPFFSLPLQLTPRNNIPLRVFHCTMCVLPSFLFVIKKFCTKVCAFNVCVYMCVHECPHPHLPEAANFPANSEIFLKSPALTQTQTSTHTHIPNYPEL